MPIRRPDRSSLPADRCARDALRPPMSFGWFMLDSPSLDCPFGICQNLVQALHPAPAWRPRPLRNGKGVALGFLGGTCGPLGDSCGHSELPRRDADEAL